jgi:hypothetical protein
MVDNSLRHEKFFPSILDNHFFQYPKEESVALQTNFQMAP